MARSSRKSRTTGKKKSVTRRRRRRRLLKAGLLVLLVGTVAGGIWTVRLSRVITERFEAGLWAVPSRIYSAPLKLRAGEPLSVEDLGARLDRMRYRRVEGAPSTAGEYRAGRRTIDVHTRDFDMPSESLEGTAVRVKFRRSEVSSVRSLATGRHIRAVSIEPELVSVLHGVTREERTVLPLSGFPTTLVHSVLAAEDQRFFEHSGLDPLRIVRAMWENVRRGGVVQGGSTITQQTVKNLFLTPERSWARKSREAVMALILEARYPKEKILEVYLNEIYLGQRGGSAVCGFGEAARHYFGREAKDLTLAESALLAGLIPAPAAADPFRHPDRALTRRNVVLRQMRGQGRITDDQHRKALEEQLVFASGSEPFRSAPHFVQFVRAQLLDSFPEERLTDSGLRVFTTLDTRLQRLAESTARNGLERLERHRKNLRRDGREPIETALITLRPGTGDILALVGGRDFGRSQFDRAVQARRQPGSLFKPLVALAGFTRSLNQRSFQFTSATIVEDTPFELLSGGRLWRPVNYDEEFRGPVSVRRAVEESINVPMVRASQLVGLERVVDVAQRVGIESPLEAYPSTALGAQEVTVLEIAGAYAAIANGGLRIHPTAIIAVTDSEGRPFDWGRHKPVRAVPARAAYLTLDMLRGVMDRGTARSARDAGLIGDLAGKTGTTNGKRDSWFVGMSPDLLTAVWIGFDDNARTQMSGSSGALPLWIDFMRGAGWLNWTRTFPEPAGLVRLPVDPVTGGLAAPDCPEVHFELFIEGREPEEICEEHAPDRSRWLRRLFRRRLTGPTV